MSRAANGGLACTVFVCNWSFVSSWALTCSALLAFVDAAAEQVTVSRLRNWTNNDGPGY